MNVTVNDVTYYVDKRGSGEPILFLHGFTGDHSTWRKIGTHFEKEFQVISVDIIGHGATEIPSDPTRYDIKKVAADLASILKEMNIDHIHLIGYSMGGRLALTFALLYPCKVKTLILESSSPGLKTAKERSDRVKRDQMLAKKILTEGITSFVDYWEKIPLFSTQQHLPSAKKQQLRTQRLQQSELGLANSLRGMGTGKQPSWWDNLHELNIPVLLLTEN